MQQPIANTPESTSLERFQKRLRRVRRRRGVTLVEVLIVVAIMALIAGGVSFMVIPKMAEARIDTARTTARNIRQVAVQFVALKGGDCPTVDTLVREKELDSAGNVEDPWGHPYTISCSGDDVGVSSAGPDGKDGSEDDIKVGAAAGGEG